MKGQEQNPGKPSDRDRYPDQGQQGKDDRKEGQQGVTERPQTEQRPGEPFDEAAVRAASAEGFVAAQVFFRAMEGVLGQAGARLSAEDRQQLRLFAPPSPPR